MVQRRSSNAVATKRNITEASFSTQVNNDGNFGSPPLLVCFEGVYRNWGHLLSSGERMGVYMYFGHHILYSICPKTLGRNAVALRDDLRFLNGFMRWDPCDTLHYYPLGRLNSTPSTQTFSVAMVASRSISTNEAKVPLHCRFLVAVCYLESFLTNLLNT